MTKGSRPKQPRSAHHPAGWLFRQWMRLMIIALALSSAADAQLSENTNNESKGSSNSFTITVTSTHGVQTSASRTPDFKVETYGNMVVGPGSTSIQENKDGASGVMSSGSGIGEGQTGGVSGMQRINFGEGTRYEVKIIPKTDAEICPNGTGATTGCTIPEIGNANASSTGNTTTSITVTSTESSFVNSFVKSFAAN
jgi:hypothetical protein